MRTLRRAPKTHRTSGPPKPLSRILRSLLALHIASLAIVTVLTHTVAVAREAGLSTPTAAQDQPSQQPLVRGENYTLTGKQFRETSRTEGQSGDVQLSYQDTPSHGAFVQLALQGPERGTTADDTSDSKEKSLKGDLTIPQGARQATFTSDPTQAPIDFTDVAPHWWADIPENTSVQVELRTSKDGNAWGEWEAVDAEDIIMPQDSITETYASMVSVGQVERTHRYVQSRVTLLTSRANTGPTFHELTYTFIDGGVTPNPPKPQVMMQGTPADVPKPLMVSRKEWGSPQGEASPKWKPKYKRPTHIVVHHTATSNNDTDWAARVRSIWYYHTYTRKWGDVGYNYLVDPNGVIYEGRAGGDDVEAGHAYPFNNGSVGIGMIGNFMKVAPSAAAQAALIDLISWKASQRGIDPTATEPITGYTNCGGTLTYVRPTIAGHRDYKGKACGVTFNTSTCPGDRLWDMLPQIRAAVVSEQPPLRSVFTAHDTPGNLDPRATVDVHLSVRNGGSLEWPANGQGAVSIGYRWITPDDKPVKDDAQEKRTPLPRNVPFASTVDVTVKLSTPSTPGHYVLLWDMYRDGQGWFSEQGSRALRVDVVIGKGVGDKAAPRSSILPIPVYSSNTEIVVRWAGEDEPRGSGVVSYDIQFRLVPNGAWTDWQSATSQTQATFDGEDGYTYEFRSRARDAAGNVETWPEKGQAYTNVDTRPPLLTIDSPADSSYVSPGPLVVKGKTEAGAFVAVNDMRAQESGGVFLATVQAEGRDFVIHVTAADPAGNVSRLEVTVQAAPRYTDLPMDDPAFAAVEYLSDKGIVSGYPDGSFRPDADLTRAQLAKMIVAARGWSLIKPMEGRFSDVPDDSWMFPYVETVVARGAMQGYPNGTFRPNSMATRADVVRCIVLAAGWPVSKAPRPAMLPDGQIPHWSDPYVAVARRKGIITTDQENSFHPDSPATRSSASAIIYNMIVKLQQPLPDYTPPEDGPE